MSDAGNKHAARMLPMRSAAAQAAGAPPGRASTVWWLRPTWVVVVIVVPTAIGAFVIPSQDYFANWGTPKYFDAGSMGTVLAAVVALVAPSLVVARLAHSRGSRGLWGAPPAPREMAFALRAYRVLMALTLFGYATWAYLGVSRGVSAAELGDLFSNQTSAYALKATLTPVTGLTTFAQFGIATAGLGTFLFLRTRRRTVLSGLILLTLLSAARALIFSERLALIEIGIVVIVVTIQHYASNGGPRATRRAALVPLLAVPALVLLFAGTEYTRSYQFYSTQSAQLNLITFSAERLEGYYATSYNNSVIAANEFWRPGEVHVPYFTFGFVWDFPLIKGNTYTSLTGIDPVATWAALLSLYANPEFNNSGGITAPLADFGVPVGLVILAGAGLLVAIVFRRFERGDPMGILLYPILFVGIFDLPREFYWGSGRAFPSIVAAIVIGYMWRRRRRKAAGDVCSARSGYFRGRSMLAPEIAERR